MNRFIQFDDLTNDQIAQYRYEVKLAFPPVIQNSQVVLKLWDKVERYFPEYQRILITTNGELVGLVCTLPFQWNDELDNLPDSGWDWLMNKGISDFEQNITPNTLGGLQIVISQENKGTGLSKLFIAEGKEIMRTHNLSRFVLPIRPTQKHHFPEMEMSQYINLETNGKIYDPWIRTHLNSGAKIIMVCPNAMNVKGNISFWESLIHQKIKSSGWYKVPGALNLVNIDMDRNTGEYREDNIWVYYNSI